MESSSAISEALAIQLLRSLYGLDAPIGRLDALASGLPAGPLKESLVLALGELIGIVHSELMAPIFRGHPQLGTPAEPAPSLRITASAASNRAET